jgi:hypothetical protein
MNAMPQEFAKWVAEKFTIDIPSSGIRMAVPVFTRSQIVRLQLRGRRTGIAIEKLAELRQSLCRNAAGLGRCLRPAAAAAGIAGAGGRGAYSDRLRRRAGSRRPLCRSWSSFAGITVQARRIAEVLEPVVGNPEAQMQFYAELLKQQRAKSHALATLATKLRLSPQSPAATRSRNPSRGPPWERRS